VEGLVAASFGAGVLAAVAARALETARQGLGVRRTALFWLDDTSGRLTCVATAGPGGTEGWVGETLAHGLGMASRAVREGRPVWTPDLLAEPRVPIAPWLRDRMVHEELRAVAAAPVRIDGAIRGALGFLDGLGRTFDEDDLRGIGTLAEEVATSVARGVEEGRRAS
jgi:GAF domain-containing protein